VKEKESVRLPGNNSPKETVRYWSRPTCRIVDTVWSWAYEPSDHGKLLYEVQAKQRQDKTRQTFIITASAKKLECWIVKIYGNIKW